MVLGTLEIVGSFKVLMVLIVLAAASIMDIKYRRIPDRFWIIMMVAGMPLLAWEIWLKGGSSSQGTLLALMLPAAGFLFIIYGYPEFRKVLEGSKQDILFTAVYVSAVILGIVSFFIGNRDILAKIGLSLIFMAVYFILYTVPIGGARLIHGGADAKCLISLAALFPWYISELPFQTGPFYSTLSNIPSIGTIFPVHLSILFNGAVISALVVVIMIPLLNIIKGNIKGLRPTSYLMDIDQVEGKFVWMIMDNKEKKDPVPRLVQALKRKGVKRIRVTPKIPFILYLFIGTLLHAVVGNLVLALVLL